MAMWHSAPPLGSRPASQPKNWDIWPALLVLLAAFLVRLWAAAGTFLNPDEALHFLVANQLSWAAAYNASLSTAHPPGLIFLLYFWRALGTSEWWLRLPSILAGTLFCWLLFRWLQRVFNPSLAWIGFLFASFLPPVVALSGEVRQYACLLMFMAAAMYLLERALAERSSLMMFGSGVCLWLAIAFHYSGLLFAVAFGIYALLRILRQPTETAVLATWAAGQLAALALFAFFYVHHISRLSGSVMAQQSIESWLGNSYYHPGSQSAPLFLFARTFGVFQFLFGQLAIGDVAGVAFFAALVVMLRRRAFVATVFLLLPFFIAGGLAVVGKYPYGGTRHSAFLVPFAIAGVSVTIDALAKGKIRNGLALASVIIVLSLTLGAPHRPYMTRSDQRSANMHEAIDFIHHNVKPEQTILTDYQTSLLLGHYLCEQKPITFNTSVKGFEAFRCAGLRVISTGPQLQIFSDAAFLDPVLWTSLAENFAVRAGQTVWVMQAGWDIKLGAQGPGAGFGRNIQVFQYAAPQ